MLASRVGQFVRRFALKPALKPVTVTAKTNGWSFVADNEGFELKTDMPKPMGANEGSSPVHMLLTSLIACENATAQAASQEMKVKVNSIDFTINGELDLNGFMGLDEPKTFEKVVIEAKVDTTATEEQLQELGHMVHERCPIAVLFDRAGCEMDITWIKA
eukprot:TRINITY_DN3586_c0_g1_i1.p1 TRINITY_DN3586_c0_g1~~TRINITY_DN3586_c0_g1_i1.p1  ORF type:complete len:160 (-),score=38.98 TRINITY_DN3586_c0_g1_i1:168-647(-)